MQNSRLLQACFPLKIVEVWINRYCVRYDWWWRQQTTSSMSPLWYMLAHWGRDKMATIFRTTFSNAFSWMKIISFYLNSVEIWIQGSNYHYIIIGSDDGLAPIRRQAIIWTNGDLIYWRTYASLGSLVLATPFFKISPICYHWNYIL